MKLYLSFIFVIWALIPQMAVAGNTIEHTKPEQQPGISSETVQDDEFDSDIFQDDQDEQSLDYITVPDPLEKVNRAMFVFNDKVYVYGLKPLATGYSKVVPTVARKSVKNFFSNLLFPVRFINDVLQGKGEAAGMEFSAFIVNTTLGFGGLNDFAQKHVGIFPGNEDLGQTLGSYGMGNGFYLVVPVLGPCTFRDALGRTGDWFVNPVNYVQPTELSWGVWGVEKVNGTSFYLGEYDAFKKAALDPYAAMRNAYIQNRNALVNDQAGALKLKDREE